MEALLVIALIASNGAWIFYLHHRDRQDANERRELMNRVAKPDVLIEDREIVEAENEWQREAADAFAPTQEMTLEERAEYSAVGRVNPDLERSDG